MKCIVIQTANCIVTGKPARCWSGHVVALMRNSSGVYSRTQITAGFVDSETHEAAHANRETIGPLGYYGEWMPENGIQLGCSWDDSHLTAREIL